jgi:lipoprotein-releasing system permease protein
VAGVFRTNFAEYDSEWIFVEREALRNLARMPGEANVVEIGLSAIPDAGRLAAAGGAVRRLLAAAGLSRALSLSAPEPSGRDRAVEAVRAAAGEKFSVADTLSMNGGLFEALFVQKVILFIVIGLIVGVSTFNVVATLVMTVQEKKRDIGILSSMGAPPRLLSRVFLWLGGMLGGAGVAAGVAFGVLVCWAVTTFRLLSFPPGVARIYFVSYIPFRVDPSDLLWIVTCSAVAILAASVFPAWRAARLDVAEALRYE